jgi:hypothetical protein
MWIAMLVSFEKIDTLELVSQTFISWNPLFIWVRQLDSLRSAVYSIPIC